MMMMIILAVMVAAILLLLIPTRRKHNISADGDHLLPLTRPRRKHDNSADGDCRLPSTGTRREHNNSADGDHQTLRSAPSISDRPDLETWDVFLSFRGADTRKGLTDHLYVRLIDAGVWVFRDDEELRVGNEIGPELDKAIRASKISIPIISPNYGFSKRCLQELVHILECKKATGQVVLPIFYEVERSSVRNQTGTFGKAFHLHEKKYGSKSKVVQEWRNALVEVTSLKGWESSEIANGDEEELVKIVVTRVLNELRKATLHLLDRPVGIEHHVEFILKMVEYNESGYTQAIVIHGMGGIGKTTLAKAVFNQLSTKFKHCTCLLNIRERLTEQKWGLEDLQKQLISGILGQQWSGEILHVDEGINIIKDTLKQKKVLVLFDDVEHSDQLNALARERSWFKSGSILIITTRNKNVLRMWDGMLSYELNELDPSLSFLLFCKHAFGRDECPSMEFQAIATDIVATTGGLPLAIEVIGSMLYRKSKIYWEGALLKLRDIPHRAVQEQLRITYDSLDYSEKQIFLDIACLPIQNEVNLALYMWDDCGFSPQKGIEKLISLSLIKMGQENQVTISDQLRDLGRAIVLEEGGSMLGNPSRLWDEEQALEVMQTNQGMAEIQALNLFFNYRNSEEDHNFTSKQFEDMRYLRFLWLRNTNLVGDFKNLLLNLRWLRWEGRTFFTLPINFRPKKLVVLEIWGSSITEQWEGWAQVELVRKLKVLKLHCCNALTETPDFSAFEKLEILILSGCRNLRRIHPSIWDLKKTLQTLDVTHCENLQDLPKEMGKMEKLRRVLVDGTLIRTIPISEGYMTKPEIPSASPYRMEETERWKGKEAVHSRFEYDVFLSFGSPDVPPDGFTSLLYQELKDAGFRVYMDDGEIRSSEDIYPELTEAIENSRLSIPIFSPDYACDMSCLNEVAKMHDCWRSKGQFILPIFYYVEPSEVCKQTGPFWDSFRLHQEKGVSPQALYNWRKAVKEIGEFDGYHVHMRGDQAEVISRILAKVVELLKPYEVQLDDDYLVAIEQPVLNVLQFFSGSVQIIGICGIPGIGKTTLAKALYHKLLPEFKHCCFIISIRERSERKGLNSLQTQLIQELLPMEYGHFSSFEENLKFIEDRFCSMRVLLVLDDVECLDHIKAFGVDRQCFGPGSRIILTTRKPELLVEAKVPHRYFVEELDESHSLELFCRYAFEENSPEGKYDYLSTEIALCSRGIPRVIVSVGSYLSKYRNKETEKWEEVLQQLRSCQYEPLQESLMLSHDDLPKGQWHFYHETAYFPMGDSNNIAHYDVVLSFDARDRVKNLVESLHRRMEGFGLGIFALNGDTMQVNDIGKIFIPILSKGYVSNLLCLEMLAHMVECRRGSATNHILPIFYAFEPSSDDRLQTPLHESCNRWLLPETFTTEEFNSIINSVCQMALDKLKLNQSMENHLVAIGEHVESILNLLNLEVNDVRSIAIRGKDGTGKTTLAKIIYHQLSSSFEGCCFLTEIDERTQHHDGIKYLQAKLIADLLNEKCEVFASVTEGTSLIKQRFQHMRVLIILDDVAESSYIKALVGQLNWFGPGSRIIIIANVTIEIPLPHSNYQIQQIWTFEKLYELFSMHAFRKGHPLPNFQSLSVEMAAQLSNSNYPCLVLEKVGSILYGKGEEEWQNMLENLGDMDLKRILRMSYDRLDEMQKKTFLDISCIPIDLDRQLASCLWYNSFRSSAFIDIEALILLSLVRVDANNEIWMHRVVRDFGREIADPGETLEFPAPLEFERMDNVRFLKLDNANANGSTNRVYMRQRDFIWQCPPDLLKHEFQRLEVLDMSWSKISEEDWEGWDENKVPQLRVLNLTGCSNLMLTPNFSFCPNLEILILEQCSRLVRIDPSIGKLQCLITLSLRYCRELRVLPEEVGCLTALRELSLDGVSLQEIPSSITHLENLHILTAINCFSLSYPPGSSRKLQSVTISKLDYANITELPYFTGEKMKLQHLSLRGCRGIKTLAALVGEVESSLVELDVSETSISKLPESIIKLKALRVLKMEYCLIREFPPGFGGLKRLEEIHASWCRNLKQLPDDFGELKSLRILILRNSRISDVPKSIQDLGCLRTLDCTSCNKLQNLPKLPFSLASLHIESKRLKTEENDFLYWLHRCSSLRTLGLCFPSLTDLPAFPDSLLTLTLRCRNLKNIPSLPSTIVVLSIQDCESLMEMPNLENLQNLQEMEILCCPGVQKIEGLERLQAMRVLTISSSGIVSLGGLDKLTSLMRLTISDCPFLHEFPDPSVLRERGVDVHWL